MHWLTAGVSMLPQVLAVSQNALRNYQLMVFIPSNVYEVKIYSSLISEHIFIHSNIFLLVTVMVWYYTKRSQGSSVSIVSDYRVDDRAIEVRSPAEARGFFL
jgi:hypothetical protein